MAVLAAYLLAEQRIGEVEYTAAKGVLSHGDDLYNK